MKINFFTLLTFLVALVNAQDLENYKTLRGVGPLPEAFVKGLGQRVADQRESTTDGSKKHDDFLLGASFDYNELLLSGKVLYGDPLSEYVTEIGQKLLEKESFELKNQMNFFVLKSHVVNAFTTNEGNVFITIGLIAQIETEAQLAMVLGHEIEHFVENHIISGVENDQVLSRDSNIKSGDDYMIRKSKFNQEQEMEADTAGLIRVLSSGYSPKSLIGVFDVLEFGYLPINDLVFDTNYFNTPNLQFNNAFLDEINPIDLESENDDQYSSHPEINKRRRKITTLLNNYKGSGSIEFIHSEAFFKHKRDMARFELVNVLLRKSEYEKAIYNIFCLQKEYPDNLYLEKQLCLALYFVNKVRHTSDLSFNDYYKDITGESQQVYYFCQKVSKPNLMFMTIHKVYSLYNKTQDKHLYKVFEDLVFMLNDELNIGAKYFLKEAIEEEQEEVTEESIENDENLSKYEKLRKLKELNSKSSSDNEENPACFVDLFQLKNFENELFEIQDRYDEMKELEKKKEDAEKEKDKKEQETFKVDKLTVINPRIYQFKLKSNKKKVKFYIGKSLRNTEYYRGVLSKFKDSKNLPTMDIIDNQLMTQQSEKEFYQFVVLNDLMKEFYRNRKMKSFIPLDYNEIEQLKKSMDLSVLSYVDLMTLKKNHAVSAGAWLYSALFYPTLPFTIIYALTNTNTISMKVYMVDLQNYQVLAHDFKDIKGKRSDDRIKSLIYNQLTNISKQ